MDDGCFQWDDAKAAYNVAVHHVKFEIARLAFDDPYVIDWIDDRQNYGEV